MGAPGWATHQSKLADGPEASSPKQYCPNPWPQPWRLAPLSLASLDPRGTRLLLADGCPEKSFLAGTGGKLVPKSRASRRRSDTAASLEPTLEAVSSIFCTYSHSLNTQPRGREASRHASPRHAIPYFLWFLQAVYGVRGMNRPCEDSCENLAGLRRIRPTYGVGGWERNSRMYRNKITSARNTQDSNRNHGVVGPAPCTDLPLVRQSLLADWTLDSCIPGLRCIHYRRGPSHWPIRST